MWASQKTRAIRETLRTVFFASGRTPPPVSKMRVVSTFVTKDGKVVDQLQEDFPAPNKDYGAPTRGTHHLSRLQGNPRQTKQKQEVRNAPPQREGSFDHARALRSAKETVERDLQGNRAHTQAFSKVPEAEDRASLYDGLNPRRIVQKVEETWRSSQAAAARAWSTVTEHANSRRFVTDRRRVSDSAAMKAAPQPHSADVVGAATKPDVRLSARDSVASSARLAQGILQRAVDPVVQLWNRDALSGEGGRVTSAAVESSIPLSSCNSDAAFRHDARRQEDPASGAYAAEAWTRAGSMRHKAPARRDASAVKPVSSGASFQLPMPAGNAYLGHRDASRREEAPRADSLPLQESVAARVTACVRDSTKTLRPAAADSLPSLSSANRYAVHLSHRDSCLNRSDPRGDGAQAVGGAARGEHRVRDERVSSGSVAVGHAELYVPLSSHRSVKTCSGERFVDRVGIPCADDFNPAFHSSRGGARKGFEVPNCVR